MPDSRHPRPFLSLLRPASFFFLLPASFLLLALALRAYGLDRWGLWYDEAYCWWVASQVPLREMLALSAREIVPPLYYLMLRAWIPLAGRTEFALRWPSVLLGAFTVASAGRLAWRLTGRRSGALAAMLLFAVGTPFLWASREVRMYGPALAWTLLADVALLEVFAARTDHRRRFWAWVWAGSTLAALYSLSLAAFWLVGQGLIALVMALLGRPPEKRGRRSTARNAPLTPPPGPLPSPTRGEGRESSRGFAVAFGHRKTLDHPSPLCGGGAGGGGAPSPLCGGGAGGGGQAPLSGFRLRAQDKSCATLPTGGEPSTPIPGEPAGQNQASPRPWGDAEAVGCPSSRAAGKKPGRGPGEPLRALLLPALVVGVLYLPWVWVAARMAPLNMTYWHGYMPPSYLLRISLGGLTIMEHLPAEAAGRAACLILLAALAALLISRPRLLSGLYPLLYAAPLFLIAYAYREIPKWGTRHATLFAPATFLALGIAWGSLEDVRRRGWRALVALILTAATLLTGRFLWEADRNLLTNPAYAKEDWRAAARYIQEHRAPNDVVIISTGSVFPTWLYYAGGKGMLPMPDDPLLDVTHVLTYPEVARQLNAALASCASAPCDPATCDTQSAPCSVWVVAWLDGITDPTRLVETLLEDVGREEPAPYFRNLRVRRFLLDGPPDFPPEPPTTARPDAELLQGIRLWGYALPAVPHPADRPLELRVWWTTEDPKPHTGRIYMASFRVQDALGTEWGQDDRIVTDGDYRPERWAPGVPVFGRFFLRLPAGIPPGVYTPTLTLFATEAKGQIALRPITVIQPAAPPEMPGEFTPVRPAGTSAPLELLGIHLFQSEGAPCRKITGELFWEVRESLREEYRIAVGVGEYREENPLAPADSQALLRPGDRIRSYFQVAFPCRALDLEADLEVHLLRADGTATGGAWLGPTVRVRTERVFAEPTVPYEPVGADFGPGFATLLGYRIDPPDVRAGQPFTVTLVWRAGYTDDVPRSVFVHVTPPDMPLSLVTQHDGWPGLNGRPTHTWVWGEIVTDPHPLPGLPAGTYQVRVGLYSPDGERLPVVVGAESPPDRAVSFPIRVQGP